jgi:hypothetical protein
MAEQEEKQAIPNLIQVFGEANQAIMESVIAAQQRNMKFTQGIFTGVMEVLKSHAESTRGLMQQLELLAQKQQEALQKQAPGTGWDPWMQSYMGLLRIGLSSYQQALDAAEQATQQQLEHFEKASEDFEQAAQQRLQTTSEPTSR